MPVDLLAPLDDLAAALEAAEGIRSASADPAEVQALPGVLVQLSAIDFDLLGGYSLSVRLLLVVANNGHRRSRVALAALLEAVTAVIDPEGTVAPVSVTLPSSITPLPALSVPVVLRVTN